jgi:hypothetical protein
MRLPVAPTTTLAIHQAIAHALLFHTHTQALGPSLAGMVLQLPHAPTVLRRQRREILLGATATVSSRLQRGGQRSYPTVFRGGGGGHGLGNDWSGL